MSLKCIWASLEGGNTVAVIAAFCYTADFKII